MSQASRKTDFTLVLLGFQGSGKSATGNSILKRKCFQTGIGTMGTTKLIQRAEWSYRDKAVTIVDTPAISKIYDLSIIRKALSRDEIETAVYAITITIGRFTQEERQVVGKMLTAFHKKLKNRAILVFTRQNELEGFIGDRESRLEAWLNTTPTIREWIATYNFPYFAIENSDLANYEFIEKAMMESLLAFEPKYAENNVSGVISNNEEIQEHYYGLSYAFFTLMDRITELFHRYVY